MNIFRLSIKLRIFLTFILISIGALWLYADSVSSAARRHYLEASEEVLYDNLLMMRSLVMVNYQEKKTFSLDELQKIIDGRISTDEDEIAARIYEVDKKGTDLELYLTNERGIVNFHSFSSADLGEDYRLWRNVRLALKGIYGARSTRSDEDDPTSSVLHVSLPLKFESKIIGTITLVKPVKRLSIYLGIARVSMQRKALLTLALLLLLGLLLMRRIVRPIERLTEYASSLSNEVRPPRPRLPEGELSVLAGTMEDMLVRLDGKAYVESYIQTLSHELKSPLAAVHGAIELLEGADADQSRRLMNNINRETCRMTEMVEKILVLSRLENKPGGENFVNVDLRALSKQVIAEMSERFVDLIFRCECDDATLIKGDAFLLKLAIRNLLQNASEFSSAGNVIEVNLYKDNKKLILEIVDEGEGIPQYAEEKLFERFYSLPRPQSGRKSSGLGLAIVKEIIHIHGAEITVHNRKDGKLGVKAKIIL